MKKIIIITGILSAFFTFSQKNDSITFTSQYEKSIFDGIEKKANKILFIESMFAIDSSYTFETAKNKKKSIYEFLNSLDKNKINKYNERKKIKYIFKKVHDHFLNEYKDVVNFSQIFNGGIYNCVSASALYSYIFDELEIPYQIKETPTHVFLVAYPNQFNIYVETTIPGNNGFYSPSENDIKKAVDELINNKLLTKKSVTKIGYQKAYMDFFFEKEFLKPTELIGIQYYNQAISYFQKENYEDSFNSLLKAEKFYMTNKIKYLKMSAISNLLIQSDYTKENDIKNIIIFLNLIQYQKEYFYKDVNYYIANIITSNESNESFLINAIKELEKLNDKNVLTFFKKSIYRYIAERRFRLDRKLELTLEFAIKAYELDKENEDLENLISNAILKKFFYITPNVKSVEKIEKYEKEYPFIKKSSFYKKYMINVYSFMTVQYFQKKKLEIGLSYFEKLKEIVKENNNEIELDMNVIGSAYWSLGAYYYSKNELKKAKKILEEGNKIAPNHEKLNKILSYVNDDLN